MLIDISSEMIHALPQLYLLVASADLQRPYRSGTPGNMRASVFFHVAATARRHIWHRMQNADDA